MTATDYPHIVRDDNGILRVGEQWYKVIMLIGDHVYRGMDTAALIEAHPGLTLGEAHSLLAYYYDHKDEIDAELARRLRYSEEVRATLEDPVLAARMREGYRRWLRKRA